MPGSDPRQKWLDCPEGALALQVAASTSAGEGPRGSRILSRPAAPAGQSPAAIPCPHHKHTRHESKTFSLTAARLKFFTLLISSSWPGDYDCFHHFPLCGNQPDVLALCEEKVLLSVICA